MKEETMFGFGLATTIIPIIIGLITWLSCINCKPIVFVWLVGILIVFSGIVMILISAKIE